MLKSGDVFVIFNKSHERTKMLILLTSIAYTAKVWYSLFFCATELHYCPRTVKNMSVSPTLLQWLTCSFITMNMGTMVHFQLISRPPSCCRKYSPAHQLCINPHLKIVPNKCIIYSSLSSVCWKIQCPVILGNYFLKNIYIFGTVACCFFFVFF